MYNISNGLPQTKPLTGDGKHIKGKNMTETPTTKKKKKTAALSNNRIKYLIFLSIGLSILLSILAGITWHNFNKLSSHINSQAQQQLRSLQQQLQSEIISNKTQLNDIINNNQAQQQQLAMIKLQVANTLSHLAQSSQFHTLNQVIYLIQQAQLELDTHLSIKKAQHYISQAQQQLKLLNNDTLFALQQSLTEFQKKAKRINQTNIPKIIDQLNQIGEQIKGLSYIKQKQFRVKAHPNFSPTPTSNHHWYQPFLILLDGLKKLVIIRHHQRPVRMLPSLAESNLAKITIQTQINIAQWALLHRNSALYQSSIKQIKNTLTKFFDNQTQTASLRSTLSILATVNINPNIPNLNTALSLANQAIYQSWHQSKQTPKRIKSKHNNKPSTSKPKLKATLS